MPMLLAKENCGRHRFIRAQYTSIFAKSHIEKDLLIFLDGHKISAIVQEVQNLLYNDQFSIKFLI